MATMAFRPSEPAFGPHLKSDEKPKLRSNHGAALDPDVIGWMESMPTDTPLAEMRRKFDKEGYLLIRGLIPREDVLDVREE